MRYEITALLVTLVATTLIAGTILGASATYPFGANPVLMKNAQAQTNEMIVPEAGIKQGGGEGVEEPTAIYGPNDPLPQDGMIVQLPGENKGAVLAPGKPVIAPIEEPKPEPLPVEPTPVQTAAPVQECPSPEEVAIITETNNTATQVITEVENNVMNTETVEEVTEVVENVTNVVEESVNGTADPEEVVEVAEEVVTVVEETPEVQQSGSGLLALLEKLVESQDFNENLTDNERAALDAELETAKQELSAAFTENVI
jgi:hypothetical protein